MSRVGVDIDGPLYSLTDAAREWIHEATGKPYEEMGEVKSWNWFPEWGLTVTEGWNLFNQGVEAGRIFVNGGVVNRGIESLYALKAAGHTIHLVTARTIREFGWRTEESTVEWIARNQIPHDSLHFQPDKTLVAMDFMIDDAPHNVESLRNHGVEAYLYDMDRLDQEGSPWKVTWPEFVTICNSTGETK